MDWASAEVWSTVQSSRNIGESYTFRPNSSSTYRREWKHCCEQIPEGGSTEWRKWMKEKECNADHRKQKQWGREATEEMTGG